MMSTAAMKPWMKAYMPSGAAALAMPKMTSRTPKTIIQIFALPILRFHRFTYSFT